MAAQLICAGDIVRRRPIRRAVAFGNAQPEKNPGEVAQVVCQRDADLDDPRLGQEFGERPGKIQPLQLEQIYRAGRGRLDQTGQAALALPEDGPRLGIEADWSNDPMRPPGALSRKSAEIGVFCGCVPARGV